MLSTDYFVVSNEPFDYVNETKIVVPRKSYLCMSFLIKID